MQRRLINYVFAVVLIASAVFLVLAAVNYVRFFPAIASIQASLDRQEITVNPTTNETLIVARLKVSNPSTYSGFIIQWVNTRLHFSSPNASLFESMNLFAPANLNVPFGPGGEIQVNATYHLIGDDAAAFVAYRDQYGMNAVSNYSIDIRINTFIEALVRIDVAREIQTPLIQP